MAKNIILSWVIILGLGLCIACQREGAETSEAAISYNTLGELSDSAVLSTCV